jgi:hypothetical protein
MLSKICQKPGIVFYESSSSGYCVYYLGHGNLTDMQRKLTTGMPFRKAAAIVHELNRRLFQKPIIDDEELRAVVCAYLERQGAGEYVLKAD